MSNMTEGLVKKEGFTPEKQSPPSTKTNGRPMHDNDKVKRHVNKPPCC